MPERDQLLSGVSSAGRPPLPLFLMEGQRALLESMTLGVAAPLLERAPRGDGHPVLVLPGFSADDPSTGILRGFLRQAGFDAHPWLLGRNMGFPGFMRERLLKRVFELVARRDQKVSLVGWSLGGIYAREVAKSMPQHIRQVVTLASPFGVDGKTSNITRLFEMVSGRDLGSERAEFFEAIRTPPPVPSTAIYSRTDGVVRWRACMEPEGELTENIEVHGSHCGMGMNPLVLYAIADRLSQDEGAWVPFDRSGWRRIAYN